MITVGIIRDRGQMTIPESVRKVARWASTSSVISISVDKPDEIIIRPHQSTREVEWNNLFELIKKARDIKGRGAMNATKFIAEDREHN